MTHERTMPDDEERGDREELSGRELSRIEAGNTLTGDKLLDAYSFFAFGPRAPYARAKSYRYPFELSQGIIESLYARVTEVVLEAPIFRAFRFEGVVGYSDTSSETFEEFARLMSRAAEERDPERLSLTWSGILTEPPGSRFLVRVEFITEKRLATSEPSVQRFHVATVDVQVSGATENWVNEVSRQLDNHIQTARIGGIYRPLLVFRNRDVVTYSSIGVGLVAQVQTIAFVSNLFNSQTRKERLAHIKSAPTVKAELDRLASAYLAPEAPTYVYGLIAGFVLFAAVSALIFYALPRLVPISTIELSKLSSVRVARLRNQISLVVFGILISGILLPLLITAVT